MPKTSQKFRRNIIESRFTPTVFALVVIIMRLALFLSVGIQQQEYPTSLAWHLIYPLVSNQWVSLVASTAFIFLISFIFSNINLHYTLTRFRTSLPFTLPLFILSIHPVFLAISPNYLSAVFILLAIFPLLESYQHHAPRSFAFKSGVLIALAGVFQIFALVLLPLWWYGEKSMHGFRIKSSIALLFGAMLVFWNVAGLYFLFDSFHSFVVPFTYLDNITLTLPQYSTIKWSIVGLLILLTIVLVFLDTKVFERERVLTQKTLSFIILIIFSNFILHVIYWQQTTFFLHLLIILVSFIVAHYFSYANKRWQVHLFFFTTIGLFLIYINYLIGNPFLLN